LFDPRGEETKKREEFERMFDNSFSAMDNDSNRQMMDNKTFFQIFSNAQEANEVEVFE
jgi:hypothetical protein